MQVQENKHDTQFVPTGRKCTVCDHDSVSAINTLLASGALSNRRISAQFKLGTRAVDNHALNHLPRAVAKAAERAENKADDKFLQFIHSQMAAGVLVRDAGLDALKSGKLDNETIFRGAPAYMQAGLNAARLLGEATGRLKSGDSVDRRAFIMVIAQPGSTVQLPGELPPADPEPDDELTIDIKAIAE